MRGGERGRETQFDGRKKEWRRINEWRREEEKEREEGRETEARQIMPMQKRSLLAHKTDGLWTGKIY